MTVAVNLPMTLERNLLEYLSVWGLLGRIPQGLNEPLMRGGTHGGGRTTERSAVASRVHNCCYAVFTRSRPDWTLCRIGAGDGDDSAHVAGLSQPKLVYLQPGMRLEKKPPTGWSHLVIKSIPRVVSGDRGSLPAGASKTASLFRSVLLADVKPVDADEKDFELAQDRARGQRPKPSRRGSGYRCFRRPPGRSRSGPFDGPTDGARRRRS